VRRRARELDPRGRIRRLSRSSTRSRPRAGDAGADRHRRRGAGGCEEAQAQIARRFVAHSMERRMMKSRIAVAALLCCSPTLAFAAVRALPEPETLGLIAIGAVALVIARLRGRK